MHVLASTGMTPEQHLRRARTADAKVAQARRRVADAVEERAEVLREAKDAGVTWVALGKALGVSATRALEAARPREIQTSRRRRQ